MKIGIDMGGSHIAIGVIKEANIIEKVEKSWLDTDKENMEKSIENYIIENILKLCKKYEITEVGIGAPGTAINGIMISSGKLEIKNYPIIEKLQEKIKLPIHIRNDAKCAALAEDRYGCLKEYKRSLFLTLGTGIGGAVIINHQLLDTGEKPGCEVGHMVIQKDGIPCHCGRKGCWQQYASMKTLKNNLAKQLGQGETIHGKDLWNILKNNNIGQENYESIEYIVNQFIENLSLGIANLINIFEPEIIVIGGSFIYFEEMLLPKLKTELLKPGVLYNETSEINIKPAILGNDAGIIGAVL